MRGVSNGPVPAKNQKKSENEKTWPIGKGTSRVRAIREEYRGGRGEQGRTAVLGKNLTESKEGIFIVEKGDEKVPRSHKVNPFQPKKEGKKYKGK